MRTLYSSHHRRGRNVLKLRRLVIYHYLQSIDYLFISVEYIQSCYIATNNYDVWEGKFQLCILRNIIYELFHNSSLVTVSHQDLFCVPWIIFIKNYNYFYEVETKY